MLALTIFRVAPIQAQPRPTSAPAQAGAPSGTPLQARSASPPLAAKPTPAVPLATNSSAPQTRPSAVSPTASARPTSPAAPAQAAALAPQPVSDPAASSPHRAPARASDREREAAIARDNADARRTTIARALFEEGLRFVDAGKWQDAQDRFRRVLELRYSPVAAYNLGLAQARLGFSVVSAATLRKLLTDPALEAKVRDPAAALLVEVESRFAWLTLHVGGACPQCRVEVDREEWPRAALDVAVPIDPGAHLLELRRSRTILVSDRVELAPSVRAEATLAVPPGALNASRGPAPADSRSTRLAADTRSQRTAGEHILSSPLFWGAMGVLVAAGATALILETR